MSSRVIFVFGHTDSKNPGELSSEALARVDRAVECFRHGDVIVLSGGRPADGTTEAQKMLGHAVSCNLPPGVLVLEDDSLTTIGNIENTLSEHGGLLRRRRVILVSSGYHILRCWLIWRRETGLHASVAWVRPFWSFLTWKAVKWEFKSIVDFFFGKRKFEEEVRRSRTKEGGE